MPSLAIALSPRSTLLLADLAGDGNALPVMNAVSRCARMLCTSAPDGGACGLQRGDSDAVTEQHHGQAQAFSVGRSREAALLRLTSAQRSAK